VVAPTAASRGRPRGSPYSFTADRSNPAEPVRRTGPDGASLRPGWQVCRPRGCFPYLVHEMPVGCQVAERALQLLRKMRLQALTGGGRIEVLDGDEEGRRKNEILFGRYPAHAPAVRTLRTINFEAKPKRLEILRLPHSHLRCPNGGRQEFRMKPLTMLAVSAAVVLAGAITVHAQSINIEAPGYVEAESLPRLPSVFRDCWEPVPRHCVRPPGLLWFGSAATLAREHPVRRHRLHTAVAR
jgi:hypothetical protein